MVSSRKTCTNLVINKKNGLMIYLDNSATTFPKPDSMYEFMSRFYKEHGVNPGRAGFDAAIETEEVVQKTLPLHALT